MSRQNLRLIKAFVAIASSPGGRIGRKALPLVLRECGFYDGSPEEVAALYYRDSLRVMHLYRNSKKRRGETQLEMVNLFETKPEGSIDRYFKECGRLTVEEAAQHIRYWEDKLREDGHNLHLYREFHVERLGQPLLDFLERDDDEAVA